jgi:hypothetical protein
LIGIVRRSLPTAPMFLFDAPTRASGKTLLARIVANITTGREVPSISFTGDQDEERKRLISALLAGDAVVFFDNISHPLDGDALCSALTQPFIQDRKLGISGMVMAPTCATFIGTGNNIRCRGDMVSRVLVSRIDSGEERPEEREFDRDIIKHVQINRGTIVAAALTLMRAYAVAGAPPQNIKPFGRFEAWSDMVRAAVVWAGEADPNKTREKLEADDPVAEGLAIVLIALVDHFGQGVRKFTAAEVVATALGGSTKLQQALANVLPKGDITARTVGHYFRTHKDRPIGGCRIREAGKYQGAVIWQVS